MLTLPPVLVSPLMPAPPTTTSAPVVVVVLAVPLPATTLPPETILPDVAILPVLKVAVVMLVKAPVLGFVLPIGVSLIAAA